ncbi:hypothetical protein E8E11_008288 [Didymella keratinophila]|nr:hypothetical protein E8E11_008288 [Didymella keratinophila]
MGSRKTFYKNAQCSVLQSDGQWHRSTIQSGPFVGYNGAAYYRVQIHYPYNRHDSIWANKIRPEPNFPADYYYRPTEPSTPYVNAASQTDVAPTSIIPQSVLQTEPPDWRSKQTFGIIGANCEACRALKATS